MTHVHHDIWEAILHFLAQIYHYEIIMTLVHSKDFDD